MIVIAALVALLVTGSKNGRDLILKLAAGVLLLLSSYFAARTLKQTRADQRMGRILDAINLLDGEQTTRGAVRAGAVLVLVNLAETSKDAREARQVAIIKRVLTDLGEKRATSRVSQWGDDHQRLWKQATGADLETGTTTSAPPREDTGDAGAPQ
jgi:hypothetical protein